MFIAISRDSRPHFSRIAWFVRNLQEGILSIFCTILLICTELDLVGGELFAVDGCKICSSASREWSGTFGELQSKTQKIRRRVKLMMESHAREDRRAGKRGRDRKERQSNVTDNESAKLKGSHGTVQGYNALW